MRSGALSPMSAKLGIVAGAGELPLMLARACEASGRPFFVLGLESFAKPADLDRFPHGWTTFGQAGRTMKLLKENGCTEVVLAGRTRRPDFRALKLDFTGAALLPKFLAAIGQGDDGLLRAVVGLFEGEGIKVVGPDAVLQELVAAEGVYGACAPGDRDRSDIARGIEVARTLGGLDIGQAVVVCDGVVLAVEAIEGTDAMLARVAGLPEALRGSKEARRGVLVKTSKPGQERRVDLPAVGVDTIRNAADAGLAGVAVEAGSALVIGRAEMVREADARGLFVAGVRRP